MYATKFAAQGSMAMFYIIDRTRGFKQFKNKDDAEYAREVQCVLSQYTLAPMVLSEVGKIRPKRTKKLSNWGYMTEVATMVCCGGNEGCEYCEDAETALSDDIEKLCNNIYDLTGFDFIDSHVGNIGFVRRNKESILVCVDTGRESVHNEGY
jgi:hypothetical protein